MRGLFARYWRMMRVWIFLLTFLKFSSSSVFKSVKRDTDDKIIQGEIDEDLSDFFDEVEKAQEVLEVPIEYEDDNKPSKTQSGFPHINGFVLPIPLFIRYSPIILVPIRDVWAVRDGKAELPCDINPPDPTDQVYLVLWYRDLAGKPLYSYDLRWVLIFLPARHCPPVCIGASPPRQASIGQLSPRLDSGRERGSVSRQPRASRRWWSRTWRCWTRACTGAGWTTGTPPPGTWSSTSLSWVSVLDN